MGSGPPVRGDTTATLWKRTGRRPEMLFIPLASVFPGPWQALDWAPQQTCRQPLPMGDTSTTLACGEEAACAEPSATEYPQRTGRNLLWSIHTGDVTQPRKGRRLTDATAWMNRVDIVLSAVSWSQRTNPVQPTYEGTRGAEITETEWWLPGAGGMR